MNYLLIWIIGLLIYISQIKSQYFSDQSLNCTQVINFTKELKIVENHVNGSFYRQPIRNKCEQKETCCSENIEKNLTNRIKFKFINYKEELISELVKHLLHWKNRFNSYFLTIISKSEFELNLMFKKTYGKLYEENMIIFKEMFNGIKQYYENEKVNFYQLMNTFFKKLYFKVFMVFNSHHFFNDTFSSCVLNQMDLVKPFGEIPNNLKANLKKVLDASRQYIQAFDVGVKLIKHSRNKKATKLCEKKLFKSFVCPICNSYIDIGPCHSNCISTISKCSSYYLSFEKEWNLYLTEILHLTKKLGSTLKMENILVPLNVKLSDAIMNFQENGILLSQKVLNICESLSTKIKLNKRSVLFQNQTFIDSSKTFKMNNLSWKKLVKSLRKKMKKFYFYFSKQIKTFCQEQKNSFLFISNKKFSISKCWNGNHLIDFNYNFSLENKNYSFYSTFTNNVMKNHFKLASLNLKKISLGNYVNWTESFLLKNGDKTN